MGEVRKMTAGGPTGSKTPWRGMILKEGYPFIVPPLAIGGLGILLGWATVAWIGFLGALGMAMFFRNPTRRPLRDRGLVLSPADGKVVEISRMEDFQGAPGPWTKISVFMSVLNVHVNRSPVSGRVVEIRHEPGGFHPAHRSETSERNERNIIRFLMRDHREVICVQVAGVIARRIVCWVREGMDLPQGFPIGMIRFGSRVDTYLPEGFDPDVRVGQRVWGGETVLGYWIGQRENKG